MATGIGTAACQLPPARARRRMKAANFEAAIDPDQQPKRRRLEPVRRSAGDAMAPASSERPDLLLARRALSPGACGPMTVPVVRSQSAHCSATSGEEEKIANSRSWQPPRKAPPVPSSPHAELGATGPAAPLRHGAASVRAAAPGVDGRPGPNDVPKLRATSR